MSLLFVTCSVVSAQLLGIAGDGSFIRQFANGSASVIAPPLPDDIDVQQLATMDVDRGVYVVIGYNLTSMTTRAIGLNITTGAVVYNRQMPFAEPDIVGLGQCVAYADSEKTLIALGQLVIGGPHVVGVFNPISGSFKQIAALPATYIPVLGGSCTYHPPTNSFLFQLGVTQATINVFVMNVATGAYTQAPENFTSGRDIESMDYDAATQLVYGTAVEAPAGTLVRTLVSLDVAKSAYATVGVIDGYTIEVGGIAALDPVARSMYWIGLPSNATPGPNGPFYLVQVSLANAAIKSASFLCQEETACPQSLEFYP